VSRFPYTLVSLTRPNQTLSAEDVEMMRRAALVVGLVLACAAPAPAADPAPAAARLRIPRTKALPTLDGKLDDACWKDAVALGDFTVAGKTDAAPKKTDVRVVFDETALYLAIRSTEPQPEKLAARATERGGDVWEDDAIEIWIRPTDNPLDVDHFLFNAIGTPDEDRHRRGLRAGDWKPQWTVKTAREDGAWTAEVEIPAEDLGTFQLRRGDVFGLKVGRNDTVGDPAVATAWPAGARFGREDGFGEIVIEEDVQGAGRRPGGVVAQGPAIPITPGGEPWVITKVRVTDSRAVRGYTGAPVDGSLKSGSWDGKTWEYPMPDAGAGVKYLHNDGDGLHLTLADDQGFNAVVVRGGIKARLLRDVSRYDDPSSGQLVHAFPGNAMSSRAWFEQPVKTKKVSFFEASDGLIADVSFFRVRRGLGALDAKAEPIPVAGQPNNVGLYDAGVPLQLISEPLASETSVAAVGVTFECSPAAQDQRTPVGLSISVGDPLNPRLELHGADYTVAPGDGPVHIVCDVPDQVIPAGRSLSVTLTFVEDTLLKSHRVEQYRIPKARAIREALEHRKALLHALYTPVSEARPWNVWNNLGDEEKYFARPADTGDELQDRLRFWVKEIVTTLDQCRALDPDGRDPIVRQYHEWIRRKKLTKSPGGIPPYPTEFAKIDGVPEWAALVRQAWMQAREVPKWWIENRMAPNGEFGGAVADDSDMYQNYAPFPMFERDGVGGLVLDAGARMAELLDRTKLVDGINKYSMDPLHAYEEGMNQESIVAYWNYGDPIYLERCMTAARSTEPLTMVTEKGHRHFRSNTLGISEVTRPRPPEGEHGAHCLMWHPTLITAWYNRHPLAMRWLSEWGDGWLAHMKSGDHGHSVRLPADETRGTDPLPFTGGWGMTGSVFTFLADLTGDARFVRPYTEYFSETGKGTGDYLAEIIQMGMYPSDDNAAAAIKSRWSAVLYTSGDKRPMIDALKKDIEELQRFRHMYTTVECFTDRVFLYAAINPSIAYTGGYTTRNKLNLTYAVTWDGFGTDYAALVTRATGQNLTVLLCNISDRPITGKGRLWRLEPGEYELTFGPDADNDDRMDRAERTQTLTVTKGDEVALTLPPKVVHVLELKQTRKADAIYGRADLALAAREVKVDGGQITGVAHNIGLGDVDDVVVSLIDATGKAVQTQRLGRLAAPTDLVPKTLAFEFDAATATAAPAGRKGWSITLDADGVVPEIFEGNNRVPLGN
jgi:hypothetical protein